MFSSKKQKISIKFLWTMLSIDFILSFFAVYHFAGARLEILFGGVFAAAACSVVYYWLSDKFKDQALANEQHRAAQAEAHIEELRRYIAEQDAISKTLRQSKEKFHHAAFHDTLTNLPNRNLFIETLKFLLEKSKQLPDYNFAILYLDLNRFKTINESLGHSTGDKLIVHVAKRLKNFIREGDLVARFGGDEFAVILSNVTKIQAAIDFAERIHEKLSEPYIVGGRQVFTGVSIGIALGSSHYQEAEEVLRDADIAMYYAKDHEKSYEIFNRQMHARAVKRLQLETDLRYAIERNEFRAYFQPIVNLNLLNLYGFEALIRWQHPQRGLLSPGEFIQTCEDTGSIVPITLWMLRECCEKFAGWQRRPTATDRLILSVNLSGKHFAVENLVQQIGQILFDTSFDPNCLKLEITESAMMENPEKVTSQLIQLKSLGVQLSIDDFGTGYSSLSYLHRFPIDTLKVDRSFVSAMEIGSENGEIVRTIVSLGKILGMDIIAEGIETIHQFHQLRILGCEYGQGYLFSRPCSAEETEKLIEKPDFFKSILPSANAIMPPQIQMNPSFQTAE